MDIDTADPYEQKLYNMFKSFDMQHMDSLDRESLTNLCATLELKDRGPKLVANLIDCKRNNRVTFREFKEGLLNLLGTDGEEDDVCGEYEPLSSRTICKIFMCRWVMCERASTWYRWRSENLNRKLLAAVEVKGRGQ